MLPRLPGRLTLCPALAACLLLLAGCGNTRIRPADTSRPVDPTSFHTVRFPTQGLSLSVPRNWTVTQAKPPLLSIFSSGSAIVAVWRFPRAAPPPASTAALNEARRELIRLSRKRDPALRVIRSSTGSSAGHPDVEVDAFQNINGQRRRVRSLHVFIPGSEVVLEQYAPPSLFHEVDHVAFSPMKRSLQIQTTT